jgi:hypothetical protein
MLARIWHPLEKQNALPKFYQTSPDEGEDLEETHRRNEGSLTAKFLYPLLTWCAEIMHREDSK